MDTNTNPWWRRLGLWAVFAVIFAGIIALVRWWPDDNGSGAPKPPGEETPADDPKEPDGDLTVKPGDILPDEALCEDDEFIPNSLPSTKKHWSDAVSTQFESSDPDEMFTEVMTEHCGNPTELDMSVQALATLVVGDFNVLEHNPWLNQFIWEVGVKGGLRKAFLTKKEGKDGIFVTAEYQQYAAMVNTLLLDYKNWGEGTLPSIRNWHLPGPVAGELPRAVENDEQENLPALILGYSKKGKCEALSVIGFNVGDKRFEVFAPPKCESTTTTSTGGGTTTVPGGTTTTVPGTTTTTVPCGRKNHIDPATGQCVPNLSTGSTTPQPSTSSSTTTTTVEETACEEGTERDQATGLCVSIDPPDEDPAPDPSVPDGGNDGPISDPGA